MPITEAFDGIYELHVGGPVINPRRWVVTYYLLTSVDLSSLFIMELT